MLEMEIFALILYYAFYALFNCHNRTQHQLPADMGP